MEKYFFELIPEEEEIVANAGFFYLKHRIIEKVYGLFGQVSEQYSEIIKNSRVRFDPEIFSLSPKISRGENYLLLPYVMLDQPRYFKNDGTFSVRSLFWWGNHFSIHLVLGGKYKQLFHEGIISRLSALDPNWHYSLTDDPWHHHFEPENYQPVHQYLNEEKQYLKLGKKFPLSKWNEANDFFTDSFSQLMHLLEE